MMDPLCMLSVLEFRCMNCVDEPASTCITKAFISFPLFFYFAVRH